MNERRALLKFIAASPLLALYPAAMAFALVYTAEHYLVDILLGWAYTLVALWVVYRVADTLELRRRAGRARVI